MANSAKKPASKPRKQTTVAESLQQAYRHRFNPLRTLNPEGLANALDAFELGDLRTAAELWQAMAERDDIIKSVKAKREKAISQRQWEILLVDNLTDAEKETAERHKEVLTDFYNHITATSAWDRNERGGFALLVRQMMSAVSYRYAVHHVVWQPSAAGLTATLEFVPLQFFENRSGRLRYVGADGYKLEGEELAEGEWIITTGDGLMMSGSIGYTYKHLAHRDLLAYSDKFAMPGVVGRTNASQDSAAGRAMRSAVAQYGHNWATVIYGDDGSGKIELIEAKGSGSLPMPEIIDRANRALATLWRGADLSTISQGNAGSHGSSVQGDETDLLEQDDAQLISEVLNIQLDRWVIKYATGADRPLAYIKVIVPPKEDTALNLRVDERLIRWGLKLSQASLAERYGRTLAEPDEEPASLPERQGGAPDVLALNERPQGGEDDPDIGAFLAAARMEYAAAQQADLAPLAAALGRVLQAHDTDFAAGLQALGEQLPGLAEELFQPGQSEAVLERIIAGALVSGLAQEGEADRDRLRIVDVNTLVDGTKSTTAANANPYRDKRGRFATADNYAYLVGGIVTDGVPLSPKGQSKPLTEQEQMQSIVAALRAADANRQEAYSLGRVPDDLAGRIEDATDGARIWAGRELRIDSDFVRHARQTHPNLTPDDFARIPALLFDADDMFPTVSQRTGFRGVEFFKRIDDRVYLLIGLELNKRGQVRLTTLKKTKPTNRAS